MGLNSVSEKLVTMSSLAVHSIKREAGTGGSSVPAGHGIPVVATASRFTAPVHIDVGGQIYTSSLDTLTRLVHVVSLVNKQKIMRFSTVPHQTLHIILTY